MKKIVLILIFIVPFATLSKIWTKADGPYRYSLVHTIFTYNNDFYASENTGSDYIYKYNKNDIVKLDTGFFAGKGLVNNFTQEGNIIFASMGNKIYLSYDSGMSWDIFDSLDGYNRYQTVAIVDSSIFLQAHEFDCLHKLTKGSDVLETIYLDESMNDSIYADIIISEGDYLFAADLRDHFIGPNSNGKLYISKDRGKSWSLSQTMDKQIKNLLFHNNSLFAFTSDNGVYISKDYGETWTTDGNISLFVNKVISYKDKIFACGNQINISSDNGVTWEIHKNNGLDIQSCKDILVNNDTLYYLVDRRFVVFYSTDEGNKWIRKSPFTDDFGHNSVKEVRDTLFSTGGFTINYSANNGESWSMYSDSLYYNSSFIDEFEISDSIFVAVNQQNTAFYTSSNYGKSWKYENLGIISSNGWINTFIIMGNRILLSTSDYGNFISEDAGLTWKEYEDVVLQNTKIRSYVRINNNELLLYSGEGIYKTFDNGLSWEFEKTDSGINVNSFSYKDGNNIYNIDFINQRLYKTTDLGRTWIELNVNIESGLQWHRIVAYNGNLILLTTTDVFVSNNEGLDWVKYDVDLQKSDGKELNFSQGVVSGEYLVLTSDYGIWRAKLSDLGIEKITSVESEIENHYLYNSPPFPQPTSSIVTTEVFLDKGITLSKEGIKVFDMNGTQVEKGDKIEVSGTNWPTTLKWDSSSQPPGVYFIVIDYGENTRAIKVIKE